MRKIHNKAQDEKIDEVVNSVKEALFSSVEQDENQFQQMLDSLRNLMVIESEESSGFIWDFSKEKTEEIFCFNDTLILKPITNIYHDDYLKTRDVYSDNSPSAYINPVFKEVFIKEINDENALFMAVIRKTDDTYLGYAGIKDTSKKIWEICIELLPKYCHKGYGYIAMKSFLKKLSEITKNDKMQFRALVEVDNIASQKLMLKLGGKLEGIYDYTFHNIERAEKFEEAHLEEITEHMIELATELKVEPRKLLSHILDYRIFAEKL